PPFPVLSLRLRFGGNLATGAVALQLRSIWQSLEVCEEHKVSGPKLRRRAQAKSRSERVRNHPSRSVSQHFIGYNGYVRNDKWISTSGCKPSGTADARAMTVSDSIAAISTPPGEGAIALVRISGANAIEIADKIFRGKEKPSRFASHVQHLGEIFSAENQLTDQAVVSVHRAPASYTGEDLVEISCHGGTLVSAKVLEACLRAGVRAARPGEFTERAFLNGKMDLTQAEAVIDLIRARTDLALRSATE